MRRVSSFNEALTTGVATVDLGDGLRVPLRLDGVYPGAAGPPGAGVPPGGTTSQLIRKTSGGSTEWFSPSKSTVGLSNVDNTGDYDKPVSDAQAAALAGKVSKGALFTNVKDSGAVGDGVADDSAAILAALSTGAQEVLWPSGTYMVPVTANIPGLESRRHRGTGVILKGGNTFYLSGRKSKNQRNTLYVSPSGDDLNDGLHSSTPYRTLAKAAAAITAWADGGLDGLWRVQLAAGTYSGDNFRLPSMVKSDYPVELRGPAVGHPNAPTAVIDNTGVTSAGNAVSAEWGSWLQVYDVLVQGHAGTAFFVNGGRLSLFNCHAFDVDNAATWQHLATFTAVGGIWDGNNRPNSYGARSYYGSSHNMQQPDTAGATIIRKFTTGMFMNGGQGHTDYVRVHDCTTGLHLYRTSNGTGTLGMQVHRCATGVYAENASWADNNIDFGRGTANACTVDKKSVGDSSEFYARAVNNQTKTSRLVRTFYKGTVNGVQAYNKQATLLTIPAGAVSAATADSSDSVVVRGMVEMNQTGATANGFAVQLGANSANRVRVPSVAGAFRYHFEARIVFRTPTTQVIMLTGRTSGGVAFEAFAQAALDLNAEATEVGLWMESTSASDFLRQHYIEIETTIGG